MSKLVYAASLAAFKVAFPNYATPTDPCYRSVVYTGDGYTITHGVIMKSGIQTDGENPNPFDLNLTLTGQKLEVSLSGAKKSVTVPIIAVTGSGVLSGSTANGTATITHNLANSAWTGDQTVGPTANGTSTIVVPQLVFDKYGHYKSVTDRTARLDYVVQAASEEATEKYLTFSTGAGTRGIQYSTKIKAVGSTGTLMATVFNQNGKTLDATYAPIDHASTETGYGIGTSGNYGHVKLSDSITSTSSTSSGVAATPNAVKLAVDAAKTYADGILAANDAMVFKGTIGTGGTVTTLPVKGYSAGWTYRVITAGTYAGVACEVGDLIIAVVNSAGTETAITNSHWTVAQTNIDGVVTAANALTANRIILGAGSKGVKEMAAGTEGQVLKMGASGPVWGNDISSRAIKVNGADYLAANTSTPLDLQKGANITLTTDANGKITIASSYVNTTYTAGTGLALTGTVFSLKTAKTDEIGGVKSKTTGTTAGRYYDVEVNSDGTMKVNVPWSDTNTTYGIATSGTAGLVKPFKNYGFAATGGANPATEATAIAVNARTITTNRWYAVDIDNAGKLFTNVPWTDTHYTATMYVGATGTATNAATTNGNTYLKLYENGASRSSFKIMGAGAASVASDASGNITITGTNTWRNVTAFKLSTASSGQVLTTTVGTADLDFGDEFIWDDRAEAAGGRLHIGWAEVDADGKITYSI